MKWNIFIHNYILIVFNIAKSAKFISKYGYLFINNEDSYSKKQKDPVQFVCNDEDEAVRALTNTLEQMGYMGSKHQEDVLEDESLANEAFDDRGDYYG